MISKNLFPRKLLTLSLLSGVLVFSQCKKDQALSSPDLNQTSASAGPDLVSNPFAASESAPNSGVLAADGIVSGSYYLENALPSGYVKDGSVDYTSYIQAALDKNANIVFPGFPLLINDKGLNIGSNKTITFLTGSELRMKPSSLGNYKLLQIRGASNVTLYNPVLKGDRYKHLGTSGEWGMGLAMYGASNVTVYNLKASEFWGDGLYIADNSGVPSKNIVVSGVNATYNRRDNISVISVDGLKMENVYAAYANGTLPMAGLNFEPNTSKDELKNIVVNNIVTEGNKGPGLKMPISNLYGGPNKTVSITINNPVDKGSERSLYATLYKANKQVAGETISGVIQINNPSMERNTLVPMTVNLEDKNLRINIANPRVIDLSGKVYEGDAAKTYLTNKNYLNSNTNYSITTTAVTTPTPDPTPTPAPSGTLTEVIRINAGGKGATYGSNVWKADQYFSTSRTYISTAAVSGTTNTAVYQSERFGDMGYSIPVSSGKYTVELHFAEIYFKTAGSRVFNVSIENGQFVQNNIDIVKNFGAFKAGVIKAQNIQVTDGVLNINFKSVVNYAKISGIVVYKQN